MGQSEIAQLRKRIEEEYRACQRVFTDFTPTARHEFITKRQENIEAYFEALKQHIGPEEAMRVIIQAEKAVYSVGEQHVYL